MLEHVNADAAPDGLYTLPPRRSELDLERTVFVIGGARYRLQRLPDPPDSTRPETGPATQSRTLP